MDQVAQIREKIDIVSLISEYIPLKKTGRNFKVVCPFHSEKSPSFVVSPERQIWHCFGCSKGGDCFTFLMEYENLEFPEALRILAKKAGIELISSSFEKGISSKKERIYGINRLSCEFYHYVLTKHPAGKKALLYLEKERGIRRKVIDTFMLGFAPKGAVSLCSYLTKKKGYTKEDLIDAGLANFRDGELVDFFANRLMFPLFDHRDNIVGFSGRTIDESVSAIGKYINTKETVAYHKGNLFFGLNIARDAIKENGKAIVVEGEFDVMSCFQNGITNVVAVKGTALTENQVQLLSRYTQKISLCFDQDSPGQEAIKRSLPILEKKNMTTMIVVLNEKDPDESLKKNIFAFKKAVKDDVSVYDYLLTQTAGRFDKETADGKKNISAVLLPLFAGIENEIVKEFYLKKLAHELDTSYEGIVKEVEKLKSKQVEKTAISSPKNRQREEVLEEYLISLILQAEDVHFLLEKVNSILSDFTLKFPAYQKILVNLLSYFESIGSFDSKKFLNLIPQELIAAFDTCFLLPLPKFSDAKEYEKEAIKVAEELKTLYTRQKIKDIERKLKDQEKDNNESEVAQLKKEVSLWIKRL